MSSFTSNFKIAWLALVLGAAFVLSYLGLIKIGKVPKGDGISQEQANTVRLQRYLYDDKLDAEAVLLGTSLAANLKVERIDPKFYNLGVLGGSTQTGIEIVLRSKLQPKVVFVEIGPYFGRGLDAAALDNLVNPSAAWLAKNLPFTRQEYQPINVALSVVKRRKMQGMDGQSISVDAKRSAMEHWLAEYSSDLPSKARRQLMEQIDWAKDRIAEMEDRGIKVVLVDIPLEAEIQATPTIGQSREIATSEFPKGQYTWFKNPAGITWDTTDGLHLVSSQAQAFARALVEASHRYRQANN